MSIPSFEYVLPVIRGIQAGREYYVSMCPVRYIPKLFAKDDEDVPPEMRARRSALRSSASLSHLFLDIGLKRWSQSEPPSASQQMCLDLNRDSVPLDPSLTILYDHRDEKASLVRAVIKEVPVFRTLTDMERSTLPSRSGKLFTLSSVYNATLALLADCQNAEVKNPPDYVPLRYHSPVKGGMLEEQLSKQIELAARYWNTVTRYIPDWEQVLQKKVSAGEVRRDYVHCHA